MKVKIAATDPRPARPAKKGFNITLPNVLLVIGIVVALSVIIDFNRRIQAEQRISAEADVLRVEVTALAATQLAQATELAYSQSDAYVLDWAHSEGRYVQPGEVLVVPLAPGGATATPAVAPAPPEPVLTNFQIWWALFFDGGS